MRKVGVIMGTVATTDQQARMFGLTTGVSELFRDGKRDPREVLDVMQTIKEHANFMAVLRGTAEPNLRHDKRGEGWELIEHRPRTITSVADLELVPFLRDGEESVRGYDLIGRARYELGSDLGQEDAEFMLEHEAEIPEEFRQFYLPFLRTMWRRPDGGLLVAYLYCVGGRWYLFWSWLVDDFSARARLLRPRRK